MCGIRSTVSSVGFEAPLESAEVVTDVPVLLEEALVVVVVSAVSDGGVPCGVLELGLNDGDAAAIGASAGSADPPGGPGEIAPDGLRSSNPPVEEPHEPE
jgi:hypothetical protein